MIQKCPTLERGARERWGFQRSGEMLDLSQRDRDRLMVVRQMAEERMTVTRRGRADGRDRCQAHRILKRFREKMRR